MDMERTVQMILIRSGGIWECCCVWNTIQTVYNFIQLVVLVLGGKDGKIDGDGSENEIWISGTDVTALASRIGKCARARKSRQVRGKRHGSEVTEIASMYEDHAKHEKSARAQGSRKAREKRQCTRVVSRIEKSPKALRSRQARKKRQGTKIATRIEKSARDWKSLDLRQTTKITLRHEDNVNHEKSVIALGSRQGSRKAPDIGSHLNCVKAQGSRKALEKRQGLEVSQIASKHEYHVKNEKNVIALGSRQGSRNALGTKIP